MRIGLLGTGFGLAHARIYHNHSDVDEVVVFGGTPAKLEKVAAEFGFPTTTDIATIYDDPAIDLVDVCLPTPPHADHVIRALHAGKHLLVELPLATSMADARRVVDAHAASDWQCSSTCLAGSTRPPNSCPRDRRRPVRDTYRAAPRDPHRAALGGLPTRP